MNMAVLPDKIYFRICNSFILSIRASAFQRGLSQSYILCDRIKWIFLIRIRLKKMPVNRSLQAITYKII